jgi:cell division protein FtsL
MNMDSLSQIVTRVRQAPWRLQRQWVGLFLLLIVLTAMVAAVRINVTAQAGIFGRKIQIMNYEIEAASQVIANQEAELARLTSAEAMRRRAEDLGYQPATYDEITYVVVPGFSDKAPVDLSTPGSVKPVAVIKPEYRETLFDWFTRQMSVPGE